ncbi:MAG TPA: hypothetical protein VFW07_09390 [Parafilimonas sp.]|nr:hypothetical protein [Parafilimonas sp.]
MKDKLLLIAFLQAMFIMKSYGQLPPFSIGLKAGSTYSYIDDLETTVSPSNDTLNYIPYTLEKQNRWGFCAGLYGLWTLKGDERIQERILAVQVQMLYVSQGSNLIYQETTGFHYKMEFRYNYINIPIDLKVFPFGVVRGTGDWPNAFTGINLGIGAQIGINITSENIVYTSNNTQPSIGTDLQLQQELRNILKGRDNFGFRASIGYEFIGNANNYYMNKGISLELSYYLGLTDVVETMPTTPSPNDFFKFIETRNRNTCWQLTLGVDFRLLKKFLNDGLSCIF